MSRTYPQWRHRYAIVTTLRKTAIFYPESQICYSNFPIVTKRRVAITFFWIESSKKFHAKRLIVTCFMIFSLFKNNALLQQFLISIEPVKWDMFYKKWCEKTNIKIGSYHRFQTSTTFANLCEHLRSVWVGNAHAKALFYDGKRTSYSLHGLAV